MEWPNVVQLRRTGCNRPVEVMTKPEGPDETHEVPAHISERINVEPTAGETARFQGEPPVTAKRFSYLAASTVVKRIEQETEEQSRAGNDDAPSSIWQSSSARPLTPQKNIVIKATWPGRRPQTSGPATSWRSSVQANGSTGTSK